MALCEATLAESLKMPGIVGLIGEVRSEDALPRLKRMLGALNYESFYTKGIYTNEHMGVYIGWVTHPKSYCDCLPATSSDGKIALFLSGEVFGLGNKSRNGSAQDLIGLYEQQGDRLWGKLNGTFSGLIVDSNVGTVQLFNDRLGFEKIYYRLNSNLFYFASEAKALLQVLPDTRTFDRVGLAEFLKYGATFNERTLYSGVCRLPAASVWQFSPRESAPSKKTYFSPDDDWATDPEFSQESFRETFVESFSRLLPDYLETPLRPGLSLTGGWDTRMILAGAHPEPKTLPCYTFAGPSEDTIDVRQARKVAEAVGQDYVVLRLESDFLEHFPQYAEKTIYVGDGYAGVCLSHEIYLNRLAKALSGVRLTGNFGSEILRGASTFKEIPLQPEWFRGELGNDFCRVRDEWKLVNSSSNATRFAVFKEIPWKLATSLHLADSQLPVRTPYLDNDVLRLACIRPAAVATDSVHLSLIRRMSPDLLGIPTDRGESGRRRGLTEICRNVWFKGTFKLDYWVREGTPDVLTRLIDVLKADRFLPERHKYLDYRRWFRGSLKTYAYDLLTGSNTFVSSLIGAKAVHRILNEHTSGVRNAVEDVNALMSIELISRTLFRVKG